MHGAAYANPNIAASAAAWDEAWLSCPAAGTLQTDNRHD